MLIVLFITYGNVFYIVNVDLAWTWSCLWIDFETCLEVFLKTNEKDKSRFLMGGKCINVFVMKISFIH